MFFNSIKEEAIYLTLLIKGNKKSLTTWVLEGC